MVEPKVELFGVGPLWLVSCGAMLSLEKESGCVFEFQLNLLGNGKFEHNDGNAGFFVFCYLSF